MSQESRDRCPDASILQQLRWIESTLESLDGASRVIGLDAGRWQVTLAGHHARRRQHVFVEAFEKHVPDDADATGEPCVQLVSPFLRLPAGHALTPAAARKALKYSANTRHLRVAWTRHPKGKGAVLAAVHTLFLQDLDRGELESALEDVAKHADTLEARFSAEDLE